MYVSFSAYQRFSPLTKNWIDMIYDLVSLCWNKLQVILNFGPLQDACPPSLIHPQVLCVRVYFAMDRVRIYDFAHSLPIYVSWADNDTLKVEIREVPPRARVEGEESSPVPGPYEDPKNTFRVANYVQKTKKSFPWEITDWDCHSKGITNLFLYYWGEHNEKHISITYWVKDELKQDSLCVVWKL